MQAERHARRWTREEYYKMDQVGLFRNRRVELIDGKIMAMAATVGRHRAAVMLADVALRETFSGADFHIAVRCPLSIGKASEPQPEVAIIAGKIRDYANCLPNTAALVVEVAETSLRYARKKKGSLYASAGVPDYWIINLKRRRLEVRRRPLADDAEPFGYNYAELTIYTSNDTVAPLACPAAQILVSDLLP